MNIDSIKEAAIEAIYEDPLDLLGRDINYDEFMDWLEIAEDEEDLGISSLEAAKIQFEKFGYDHHVRIIDIKIKSLKNKRDEEVR